MEETGAGKETAGWAGLTHKATRELLGSPPTCARGKDRKRSSSHSRFYTGALHTTEDLTGASRGINALD